MKTYKLVAGILSIIFSFIITLQSCAVGFVNSIENNQSSSGTNGVIVAFFFFVAGIVSIAVRKTKGKGGNIALIILFGLPAIVGLSQIGIFKDLIAWSIWGIINALLALISLIINNKTPKAQENDSVNKNEN